MVSTKGGTASTYAPLPKGTVTDGVTSIDNSQGKSAIADILAACETLPDLAAVAVAWAGLPDAIRFAILQIVETSTLLVKKCGIIPLTNRALDVDEAWPAS